MKRRLETGCPVAYDRDARFTADALPFRHDKQSVDTVGLL